MTFKKKFRFKLFVNFYVFIEVISIDIYSYSHSERWNIKSKIRTIRKRV